MNQTSEMMIAVETDISHLEMNSTNHSIALIIRTTHQLAPGSVAC